MNLIFENLNMLYWLWGLPIILIIHLIQPRIVKISIATLFLIDKTESVKVNNRSINKIIFLPSLFAQLLCYILFVVALAHPSVLLKSNNKKVLLVIDDSISMTPFLENLKNELKSVADIQYGKAHNIEWTVMSSSKSLGQQREYKKFDDVLDYLSKFNFYKLENSFLLTAKEISKFDSSYFFTDHVDEGAIKYDNLNIYSVGSNIDNIGFIGYRFFESNKVKVMIKNFTSQSREIELSYLVDSNKSSISNGIKLGPNEIVNYEVKIDSDGELVINSTDNYPFDNVLPLVLPVEPSIRLSNYLFDDSYQSYLDEINKIGGSSELEIATKSDLHLQVVNNASQIINRSGIIYFVGKNKYTPYSFLAEDYLINHKLEWDGLEIYGGLGDLLNENDKILLWSGSQRLIGLREVGGVKQLIFNFDIKKSNIIKLPQYVILLHRFLTDAKMVIRDRYYAKNFVLGDDISINKIDQNDNFKFLFTPSSINFKTEINQDSFNGHLRLNIPPGKFNIYNNDKLIVRGALQAISLIESDFSNSKSEKLSVKLSASKNKERVIELMQLFAIFSLIFAVLSWILIRKGW